MARKAGPGESPYTAYDREIASRAQIWLHEEAPKWRDRPWVLFVSFVSPHFPLTAPPDSPPRITQVLRVKSASGSSTHEDQGSQLNP
mgnify:CR=1 FL=1